MRPTPEETLIGATALLRSVLDEPGLPTVAAETVTDVLRMLDQAHRVFVDLPPFLAEDNERMRVLLAELIRELPVAELPARQRIHSYLVERTELNPI